MTDFITEKLRRECRESHAPDLDHYINARGEIVEYDKNPSDLEAQEFNEAAQQILERIKSLAPTTPAEQEALDIQFIIGQVVLSGAALTIQIDYPDGAPEWSALATTDETHDGGQTVGEYEGVGPSLRAALMALHSEATGAGQPLQLQPIPPPFGTLPQSPEYEPDPRD